MRLKCVVETCSEELCCYAVENARKWRSPVEWTKRDVGELSLVSGRRRKWTIKWSPIFLNVSFLLYASIFFVKWLSAFSTKRQTITETAAITITFFCGCCSYVIFTIEKQQRLKEGAGRTDHGANMEIKLLGRLSTTPPNAQIISELKSRIRKRCPFACF